VTDSELRHIFVEIFNGRGNHGSFLRAFAEAFLLADMDNWHLMRGSARAIVGKYQLTDYLDTFPQQEVKP
jgi:hypothetical protein